MNAIITSDLLRVLTELADAWWGWFVRGLWQGLLSALVVGAIVWFGRRRLSAPLRYGLMILLLVKLAMPPLPGFPVGAFTWFDFSPSGPRAEAPSAAALIETGDSTMPATQSIDMTDSRPGLGAGERTISDLPPVAAIIGWRRLSAFSCRGSGGTRSRGGWAG